MCKSVKIFVFWSYQCCSGPLNFNDWGGINVLPFTLGFEPLYDGYHHNSITYALVDFANRGRYYKNPELQLTIKTKLFVDLPTILVTIRWNTNAHAPYDVEIILQEVLYEMNVFDQDCSLNLVFISFQEACLSFKKDIG